MDKNVELEMWKDIALTWKLRAEEAEQSAIRWQEQASIEQTAAGDALIERDNALSALNALKSH